MNQKIIWINIGLMVMFGAIGLNQFTENIRAVQVVGLFGSGAGFGAALVTVIRALRANQKQP
ncbi:MAG: hypothetical protein ACM3PS_14075 [Syntrophothermus sp.]